MRHLLISLLMLLAIITACSQGGDESSSEGLLSTSTATPFQPAVSTVDSQSPLPEPATPLTRDASATQVPPRATVTPVPTATPSATAEPNLSSPTVVPRPAVLGALISVTMVSRVGVLLDEFPMEMRDRVTEALVDQGADTWLERAKRQVRLTRLRLNFRSFRYDDLKRQLPLPPADLWQIRLDPSGPSRETIDGHELVTVEYAFTTTILTDRASVAVAEPALAEIGGSWEEPFILPIDPDMLLQRTGNACVNEGGFPPNSYDSENVWHFYDYECAADSGGQLGCHRTSLPQLSCLEALQARVGQVATTMRFDRLPWDSDLADQVRHGPTIQTGAPDLSVVTDDLETNRIIYRFFEPDDCALEEGAVGGTGWRRLLQFDATVHNVGDVALHIGRADAEDNVNNVFDYNLCHNHFHYSNYGDFFLRDLEELTGSKQAFCVQSTDRLSNNEISPLTHEYSCRFQGVQAGWVDEYIAGLDAQWIDITDLDAPAGGQMVGLGFRSNADRFLCEGEWITDEEGERLWESSGFTTAEGEPINRPSCDFPEGWDDNNESVVDVLVSATGSFVTAPCEDDQVGSLRNCGFTDLTLDNSDLFCRPGETVSVPLTFAEEAQPQVVRVCERSATLGTGVACTYEDAIDNGILSSAGDAVSFTCPAIRDAVPGPPAGGYSLYVAPLWPEDSAPDPNSPKTASGQGD